MEMPQNPITQGAPLKKFNQKNLPKFLLPGTLALLIIFAGVGTGWVLSGSNSQSKQAATPDQIEGIKDTADEAGVEDESAFTQTAEGILMEGGIEGEGTHHLDTGHGEEKYVYLISTLLNLDSFVGKNVKVWGQTMAGQSAGWLMDVGKVTVIK